MDVKEQNFMARTHVIEELYISGVKYMKHDRKIMESREILSQKAIK